MPKGRKKPMAQKKSRSTASRSSTYSSRSKPKTLKSYRLFSPITLVIVVVLVVMAALVSAFQTGGDNTSHALSLLPVGSGQTGLSGYATFGTGQTVTAAPVGKIRLVGTNLTGARTLLLGSSTVPASVINNSNGTQD